MQSCFHKEKHPGIYTNQSFSGVAKTAHLMLELSHQEKNTLLSIRLLGRPGARTHCPSQDGILISLSAPFPQIDIAFGC